jgi:hypothetical protein
MMLPEGTYVPSGERRNWAMVRVAQGIAHGMADRVPCCDNCKTRLVMGGRED